MCWGWVGVVTTLRPRIFSFWVKQNLGKSLCAWLYSRARILYTNMLTAWILHLIKLIIFIRLIKLIRPIKLIRHIKLIELIWLIKEFKLIRLINLIILIKLIKLVILIRGVATFVQGTVVRGDFCPRKILPVISLLKLLFLFSIGCYDIDWL